MSKQSKSNLKPFCLSLIVSMEESFVDEKLFDDS